MSNSLTLLADKLATRLDMALDGEVLDVLKQTAFKGEVSNAQMTALLVVANQYGLNPWTKEIYAFPDKRGGIVPVVGVDGWARIINNHPQFDGMDFDAQPDAVTCTIHRKDRSHPTRVTEFLDECSRSTDPWKSHPRRMLRHKAMIQCARVAFGFTGIHDRDEAERIIDGQVIDAETGEVINRAASAVPMPQRKSQQASEVTDAVPRTTEPPPTPAPANAGTINAGQVKYLQQKIAALGLDDDATQAMLGRHCIAALDTSMTVEAFDALKAELLQAA